MTNSPPYPFSPVLLFSKVRLAFLLEVEHFIYEANFLLTSD